MHLHFSRQINVFSKEEVVDFMENKAAACVEITEILSHYFVKNFVKATFLLK